LTEIQKAIASSIGVLSILGNGPKTDAEVKLHAQAWAVALAQYSPGTVQRAAMAWMDKNEFFPKPCHIRDLCERLEPPKPAAPCTAIDCLPLPRSVPLEERADKEQILECRARIEKLFGQKEMPKPEDPERKLRQMRRQLKDQGVER